MKPEQPRHTEETDDEFNEWNREHNNNENEIAEEEFNSEKAKEAARQRRILMRRKEFKAQIGKIRETYEIQEQMDAEDSAAADFFRQQGKDLIQDERLLEEWNRKVVCPEDKSWTFGVDTVSTAVKAMEVLASYEMMALTKAEALSLAGDLVEKEPEWPYERLIAARLIARFSEEGQEFAEYAGISDLNDTDPEGYWETIKDADGSVREPHFDAGKLPEDTPYD